MLNKDFLRQILAEVKSLLTLADVQWIEVPKYEELSVVSLFEKFKHDDKMMRYLPDRLPKGRLPDRTYFFNVLHTIYPAYTKELVRQAQNNRHQASQSSFEDGVVRVSDDWWQKLNEIPFTSRK